MVTNREIHRIIREYIAENGWSPSVRELCKLTGIRSTSTMHARIDRMEYMGMLRRGHGARQLVPVDESDWRRDGDS